MEQRWNLGLILSFLQSREKVASSHWSPEGASDSWEGQALHAPDIFTQGHLEQNEAPQLQFFMGPVSAVLGSVCVAGRAAKEGASRKQAPALSAVLVRGLGRDRRQCERVWVAEQGQTWVSARRWMGETQPLAAHWTENEEGHREPEI